MALPAVTGFSYDKLIKILSWNSLGEDVEYEIQVKPSASPNFSTIYNGTKTHTEYDLLPGTYDLKGRGQSSGGGLGVWTDPPEVLVIN